MDLLRAFLLLTLDKERQEFCFFIWEGPEIERVETLLVPLSVLVFRLLGCDNDLEVFKACTLE